jgi:acetyltransferase-like isoleucine patch superfamily enzyme
VPTLHTIAPSAQISPLADLDDSTRGSLLSIGAGTRIDAFVKVKFAGGSANIVIGAECQINSGCMLYSGNGITIGCGVLIAANVVLAPTNHATANLELPIRQLGFAPSRGGIQIDDDVWIGAGAVLLDGARVGRGAVIGALTLVRGEVAPYAIVAGNPARVVGSRLRRRE